MYVCVCCRSTHCDCRHSVYSHSRRSHIIYKPSLRVCVFVYMDGVLWSKRCGWTCDNKTNKKCLWTCPQSKRESVSNNPSHLSLRGTQGAMANVSTHTAFTQIDQSRRVDDGSRDGLFFCCCESRPFVRSGNTLIFLARIAVSFPLLWWVVSPFVSIVTMVCVCATTERIFKSLHRASEWLLFEIVLHYSHSKNLIFKPKRRKLSKIWRHRWAQCHHSTKSIFFW